MDRSRKTDLSALRLGFLAAIATVSIASTWPLGSPARVHAQPGQPVTLATGQFVGADSSHQGEGRALVIRLPDGQRFLRFENFKVTNGPDLYVYLSGHPAPRNSGQLHQGAAHQIGLLKGNIGNQNYALPADLDLSKFKSVAVYCKRFSVMFATAELTVRP